MHTETWVSGKIQCIPMLFLWEFGILPEWEGSAFVLLCYWASQGHCVELSSVCLAQDAWLKRCVGAGVSLLRHDPLLGRTPWINHQTVPVTFAAFWEGFHRVLCSLSRNQQEPPFDFSSLCLTGIFTFISLLDFKFLWEGVWVLNHHDLTNAHTNS